MHGREAVIRARVVRILRAPGGSVQRSRPGVVARKRQARHDTAADRHLHAVVIRVVAIVSHADAAVPQKRAQRILVDGAEGRIEARSHAKLVDVDRTRDVPPKVADIPYVQDDATGQLLLDAEVV